MSHTLDRNYWKGTSAGDVGKDRRTHILADVGFQKSVYDSEGIAPIMREGRGDVIRILSRFGDKQDMGDNLPMILHNIYGGFNEEEPREFEEISPAVRTPKGGGHIPSVLDVGNIYPSGGEAGKVHHEDGIFSTVKQGKRGGSAGVPPVMQSKRIRRLTPVECERLQGFPDGWTEKGVDEDGNEVEISDTQRYKMMGNAVTVNVVEFLGKKLKEVEGSG